MKIFIDTSGLVKKYFQEEGSDALKEFIKTAMEIIVSPITRLEANSVLVRKLTEKDITEEEARTIKKEMNKDFKYF